MENGEANTRRRPDHTAGIFEGPDGVRIYHQEWYPGASAKAVLLVVHGSGEHSGRYGNVVDYFVPRGFAVCAFDLYGHGKSGGARKFVRKFEDYAEIVADHDRLVRQRFPDAPVFLVAHSLGALIALYFLLDHQEDFRGAVLSGSLVKVPENVSVATIVVGQVLSRLMPRAGILDQSYDDLISRDPEVVRAARADPLMYHGKMTARLAAESLKAMQRVEREQAKISLPLLILHGGADRIVEPSNARLLAERVGSEDTTVRLYDGLYHEVFNEPERHQVFNDIEQWLDARL